jgi:hypothetical protein
MLSARKGFHSWAAGPCGQAGLCRRLHALEALGLEALIVEQGCAIQSLSLLWVIGLLAAA